MQRQQVRRSPVSLHLMNATLERRSLRGGIAARRISPSRCTCRSLRTTSFAAAPTQGSEIAPRLRPGLTVRCRSMNGDRMLLSNISPAELARANCFQTSGACLWGPSARKILSVSKSVRPLHSSFLSRFCFVWVHE